MTHKALEAYFHTIVKQPPVKEQTMFENLKAHFLSLWTKPTAFVQEETPKPELVDYWAFEIQTNSYECDGEFVEAQHDIITDSNDTTWMETLDKILDVLGKHYGYNIKEQVYYSVNFPLNDTDDKGEPFPGYGRCLNDERLQQILLAFPELYESRPWSNNPTEEVMFK